VICVKLAAKMLSQDIRTIRQNACQRGKCVFLAAKAAEDGQKGRSRMERRTNFALFLYNTPSVFSKNIVFANCCKISGHKFDVPIAQCQDFSSFEGCKNLHWTTLCVKPSSQSALESLSEICVK
jgi:hypothetical protein